MRRAQVTIFVIVGILLIIGIVAMFFFRINITTERVADQNPREFISSCIEEAVEEAVVKVLNGGGKLSPTKTINYSFDPKTGQRPYNYLCHTADYFKTCYNLQPMIEQTAEEEIYSDTQIKVKNCFTRLKDNLENEGFSVSGRFKEYSVDLLPGQINLNIQAEIAIKKGDSSQKFDNFDVKILSPLYSLIDLAEKVVAAESAHCYFDYDAYMLLFPEFNIRRIDYEGSKIYHLIDRASEMTFKFAIRSCVFPLR